MSIKIDIDDLPGSVGKFTMAQLASCYLMLNRNKQILSIQIKENHLPADCARIMTWNFWNSYGKVAGVSDLKKSTVRMMIYSRTHQASKNGQSARESAQQIKNASLIKRAEQDVEELTQRLSNTVEDTEIASLESQIMIKERLISTLKGDEDLDTNGTMLDPSQIGAIGRRVFEILKKGDDSSDALLLKGEFEFITTGVRPGRKDQHRFKEGGKTRIYKSDGSWRDRDRSKSKSGSMDRPKKFSSKSEYKPVAKPKPGSYVPPHLREGGKKFEKEDGADKGGSKYVPPHLRNGAKRFRDTDDNDNNETTGKYVPPSMRKKTNERHHRNNDDGDGYISLDKIEQESKPVIDTQSIIDFPELGATLSKSNKQAESNKTPRVNKTTKIDTSNVFSNLADMDWDGAGDESEDQMSEKSENTDTTSSKTSAWGGTTFADIVKQPPKEVTSDEEEGEDSNSDNDATDGWGDWNVDVKDKQVLSGRSKMKLKNAKITNNSTSNNSTSNRMHVLTPITGYVSRPTTSSATHPTFRPDIRTAPLPRSTAQRKMQNWDEDSWDNEEEDGLNWRVESSWSRDDGYQNAWNTVGSKPVTGNQTYDSFFKDKPSYGGAGYDYDNGDDNYGSEEEDDYW